MSCEVSMACACLWSCAAPTRAPPNTPIKSECWTPNSSCVSQGSRRAVAVPEAEQAAATPSPSAPSTAALRSSPGCARATTYASSSDSPPGTTATSTRSTDRQREDQAGTTDGRPGTAGRDASPERRTPPPPRPARSPPARSRTRLRRARRDHHRPGGVDQLSRAKAGQFSTMKHAPRRGGLAVSSSLDGLFGPRL